MPRRLQQLQLQLLARVMWSLRHVYLSTACLHAMMEKRDELHAHCSSQIGMAGEKRPQQCKWCDAKCRCWCHVA